MRYVITILIILLTFLGFSQDYPILECGKEKACFLTFKKKVEIIRGSEKLFVEISGEGGNNVSIAPSGLDGEYFESNLMITDGENYYVFVVKYSDNPKKMFYNFHDFNDYLKIVEKKEVIKKVTITVDTIVNSPQENVEPIMKKTVLSKSPIKEVIIDSEFVNKTKVSNRLEGKKIEDSLNKVYNVNCMYAMGEPQKIFTIGTSKYKYLSYVPNMFVSGDYIYMVVSFKNQGSVDYNMNYQEFSIKNKPGLFRKRGFENVIKNPSYIHNQITVVPSGQTKTMVVVFDKFTIDKKKKFSLEFWEDNGDRRVIVDVSYKAIINMRYL